MLIYYSFDEMKKSVSLEKINGTEVISNVNSKTSRCNLSKIPSHNKRRPIKSSGQVCEHYQIIIRPKLHKSSSLSDLTPQTSDYSFDFFTTKNGCLCKHNRRYINIYENSGDTLEKYSRCLAESSYMSWNFKNKKMKKKIEMTPDTYAAKFAADFTYSGDHNASSYYAENSSTSSTDDATHQKMATFPFKPTPSGNLKVQSNQVVFQSSTVGVLLADPTQAKVKVKFEGKTTEELDDELNNLLTDNHDMNDEPNLQLQYGPRKSPNTQLHVKNVLEKNLNEKSRTETKNKELISMGYGQMEAIDWMHVQLPKKQELFQEFYRRVHNFINTDCIVHIGREEFHCHYMVLQIYSSFFNTNTQREIELPITDLEDQCWSFMENETIFDEDTAFVLYRKARIKNMTSVMELMVRRVKRFFLPLVASKDFLKLEAEEILTFLKSDYICVTSEIEVLMAGVRWLYGDWNLRKRFSVEVMRCVRFGLISPWQLVDIKRNPENAEILEIVNNPEVQQMVDDGLAYVIIKYWYGNNSKNYYHWIEVLGLSEPAERNWIGEEKNHVTYKEFLKYLEQFMVPKNQMYQQMAMMQPPRRSDDGPGSFRGKDQDKMEMRRPKIEIPSPATLMGLTDKDKFPGMSDLFNRKMRDSSPSRSPPATRSPPPMESTAPAQTTVHESTNKREIDRKQKPTIDEYRNAQECINASQYCQKEIQQIHVCDINTQITGQIYDPPEKDSTEELQSTNSDTTDTIGSSVTVNDTRKSQKRHSVAACYLAAALAGNRRDSQNPERRPQTSNATRPDVGTRPLTSQNIISPEASLFNQSKESLARANMNKLSTSILGPSNKNYIIDGSLFNWDRETVLVFGGIDPHTSYGVTGNTGKDIYRFDPVTNAWEYVGELPEPRHHHSVAFLRGRVFLVGGADPREDDLRGKSVVVSTVWSYEPVTRSWYSESGLAIPRKNFGLVVHKMALYAIGGQDKKGRVLRSVEKFDPKTGSWSEVRSMGVARMAVAAVKYREYIWVAGGMTGEKKKPVCKIVECYNSKTNEWTEIHSLRFPRCFATLFSMNDKLYIVGGAGKISDKDKTPSSVGDIDVWDWKDRQWKQETEMSIPRHGHALAYLGTQLIIIGGVTTIYMRALSNVESFCCERRAWIRGVASLPSPLSGHGAVTLPPASLM
ncbi:uncharacterized protein LOC123691345 isoform X3 [Colias croceus]|uniref:uncharacterized protein LOC123691345 isoform X3 n=1 Tax=Colias crocea TaxID=72248 RepID=UPI001E27F533|nr:uncharacterized protein LOC123691345 isoform X3 [Colias croceus]